MEFKPESFPDNDANMLDKHEYSSQKMDETTKKAKQTRKVLYVTFIGVFAVCVVGGIISLVCNNVSTAVWLFVTGCMVCIVGIWILKSNKKSEDEKEFFQNEYLEKFYPEYKFDSNGVDDESMRVNNPVTIGTSNSSNDYLSGEYNGIKFHYYDFLSSFMKKNIIHPDENEIYFSGAYFSFDYPVDLPAPLACVSRELVYNKKDVYSPEFAEPTEISANSVFFSNEFSYKYGIYTSDQASLERLASDLPNILEYLESVFGNRKLMVGFKDRKIIICVDDFYLIKYYINIFKETLINNVYFNQNSDFFIF